MRLEMKMILLHERVYEEKPDDPAVFRYDGWDEAQPAALTEHQRGLLQGRDPAVCGRPFVTQTHFTVGEDDAMYVPSFWLVPDAGEDASGLTVAYALPDGGALHPLAELAPGSGGFYDRPSGRYKKTKIDGKKRYAFDYDNGAASGALGTVQPGETDLYVCGRDGAPVGPRRRLVVLPSSVTAEALGRMAEDILAIRRELVELDPARQAGAKAALAYEAHGRHHPHGAHGAHGATDARDLHGGAPAFQQMMERTAQSLAAIAPALARIDASPRFHLRTEARTVPAHRLRGAGPRIVRQYAENPARLRYRVPEARRTLDIYEHRLIRDRLAQLQRYAAERRARLQEEAAAERRELLHAMQRASGGDGAADILARWQRHADAVLRQGGRSEAQLLEQQTVRQVGARWRAAAQPVDEALYDAVQQELARMLALPVLRAAAARRAPWRMTQVFTNDRRYRAVYRALRSLDDAYDFTTGAGDRRLIHEKTDKLYEYWLFCRILKALVVRQGWRLEAHATVVEAVRAFFTTADGAPPPRVVLTHPVRRAAVGRAGVAPDDTLRLELFYDTRLRDALADRFAALPAQARKDAGALTPDFLFRVRSVQGGTDDVFLLDAKYRKYDEMAAGAWTERDLGHVCAEKYLARPLAAGLDLIRAAFIAHTDAAPATPTQPNAGLGAYTTYNAALDPRCAAAGAHPLRPVGAFCLVPGADASDQNLEAFFELLFEYVVGCWDTCWHCGSTDVAIDVRGTESGIAKYHMTCRHCHAFWVKTHCGRSRSHTLIKHLFNYFIEDGHKTWFVRCPACAAEAEQKGE